MSAKAMMLAAVYHGPHDLRVAQTPIPALWDAPGSSRLSPPVPSASTPDRPPGEESGRAIITVLGPVPAEALHIVDAHNHVWLEPAPGAPTSGPILMDRPAILGELREYRQTGGDAILDCQPADCGRNGNALLGLAQASGVKLVACTGFHRRRWYGAKSRLWQLDDAGAADLFLGELSTGLDETLGQHAQPVRAGFIKIACEVTLKDTPLALLEGAAWAARQTGAALAIHTEQGAAAEEIVGFLQTHGVRLGQMILCHMDKRPDFGLHCDLARAGVLLEYDSFYRPKYDPDANVWPLVVRMTMAGHDGSVALATDMADPGLWAFSGGPGLIGLPTTIRTRLQALGLPASSVRKMLGRNIADRLAGLVQPREI